MREAIVITYQPDNSLKKGYASILREIFNEVRVNRWLTYQLFRRNFLGMYKQSFMGVFWAFIMPFVSIATFIILNRSGVFNIGDVDVPYPIYASLGMAFWQIFSTGLSACAESLSNAGSMITKINFSKKSLVLASMGKTLVNFLLQCLLVGILFAGYQIMPNKGILLIPLMLIPLLCLTIGLGLILALFNTFVKDVGNGLSLLITFLMFLTPVFYVKPKIGILFYITKYNPLYYFISGARDLVLRGVITEPKGLFIAAIWSFAILVVCLVAFHLTETKIAERI